MEERVKLKLTFQDMAYRGEALGRHDGQVVFAIQGIPQEEAIVEVLRWKRRYLVGEVVEVVAPSPHRVVPPCPYFGRCGGCQWQHIEYSFQLELKRRVVAEQLRRIGGFQDPQILPTIPCDSPWHYRNHARFSVDQEGRLGFVRRETHQFAPIYHCLIMHPWISDALAQLQEQCSETTQVSIRFGTRTGAWLIQPTLKSQEIAFASGQTSYEEELLGQRFHISAASFFQVNTMQAEKLIERVRAYLELKGDELLIDAYAGVGTFALLFASQAGRVIAIEESASAVEDARVNLRGLANVELLETKAERALAGLEERPHAVILDPPRVGCHRKAIQALIRLSPERIVYVSCDPTTLARDLKLLCAGQYRLAEVQPIDMFPQTYHIECVALLTRRDTP